MDQSELKTTWKQRIVVIAVLIIVLFTSIASYAAIIMSKGEPTITDADIPEELAALQDEYAGKQSELTAYAESISGNYFPTLRDLKTRVKAYNAASANGAGLQIEDLVGGSGRELVEGDTNYLAYYIGWCSDESVFDSSFNNFENPTSLKEPLSASMGLIEGWNAGVIGMKLGGVRELTIPGELAYGETREICGGTNQPLKFIIYAFEDEGYNSLNKELEDVYNKILEYYYNNQEVTEQLMQYE